MRDISAALINNTKTAGVVVHAVTIRTHLVVNHLFIDFV
uniref:Uncharacterized protein n=1 Tax=Heterorhabditis bacteriophora TaxID=37862 RepID=A0A1I7WAI6_HETBA